MHPRWAVVVAVLALFVVALSAPALSRVPPSHPPRRPIQVTKVVKERGFSWRDAGIGAAAAGLGVSAVAAGGLFFIRTQRPRTPTL
jgi:hypothetical protein